MAPSALAAFGLEQVDLTFTGADGSPATGAGSHPFAVTTSLRVETTEEAGLEEPDGNLKDLRVEYPAGLVAHPAAVPACSSADFLDIEGDANECSDSSAVGIVEVTASSSGPIPIGSEDFTDLAPVYKLVPPAGAAAPIGFVAAGEPITAELGLADSPPSNGFAMVTNLPADVFFYEARLAIWGVPADPAHDADRGNCAFSAGSCPVAVPPAPLLTMPRSCTGPMETGFEARS